MALNGNRMLWENGDELFINLSVPYADEQDPRLYERHMAYYI